MIFVVNVRRIAGMWSAVYSHSLPDTLLKYIVPGGLSVKRKTAIQAVMTNLREAGASGHVRLVKK